MSQRVRAIQCFALLSHMQHPESAVRLVCIELLGTITSAFMADCKQV
jgi:hypothetical protein